MSWKKRKQEIKDLEVKDRFLGNLVETNVTDERREKPTMTMGLSTVAGDNAPKSSAFFF